MQLTLFQTDQTMDTYRFVGAVSYVGDTLFDRLGQRAQFTPEQFQQVMKGGAAFIPEQDFQRLGFTQQEIMLYGSTGAFPEPPADFVDKRSRARELAQALRSQQDVPDAGTE